MKNWFRNVLMPAVRSPQDTIEVLGEPVAIKYSYNPYGFWTAEGTFRGHRITGLGDATKESALKKLLSNLAPLINDMETPDAEVIYVRKAKAGL